MATKKDKIPALRTERIDEAFGYLIYRAARVLRYGLLRMFKENGFDLTPEQWFVLTRLWEQDRQSQGDLGDRIFNDRPNMNRIINSMEKKKLVVRQPDSQDGRRHLIALTEKGKALRMKLWPIVIEERQKIYKGLDDDDLKTMKKILSVLESNYLQR